MREIKFRAWIKNEKKMVYGKDATSSAHFTDSFKYRKNEVVLMQYTGYKDRNEREVYESDIYAMEEYRYEEKTVTYWTVVWDEKEYGFSLVANIEKSYRGEKYREDVYLPLRLIDGDRMKYAGNIYENPELKESEVIENE